VCRKSGLEKRRGCGWLAPGDEQRAPVWVRKGISLTTCPKSFVTPESELLLEDFLVRRRLGAIRTTELSAREAEAFVILDQAMNQEIRDGEYTK
jgi:hypothetical protein